MPRLVGGEESRLYNYFYISRKPQPCLSRLNGVGGGLHFDHDGFLPHGSDERLNPLSEKGVGIECGESRLECKRVSRFVLKGTLSDKRCQVICQATSQTYLQ
jgi:hypothetical protein